MERDTSLVRGGAVPDCWGHPPLVGLVPHRSLQSELSHDRAAPSAQAASAGPGRKGGNLYEMTDEVKSAKPGPPCKFFQTGSCSSTSDHVQNGYRQIHACSFCLANKCQFQPHTLKDCKYKKFDKKKSFDKESGFGK